MRSGWQFSCSNMELMSLFLVAYLSTLVNSGPIVDTNFGKIAGIYIDDVAVFTSIPYASNVDGENRWRDARFPFPWPGIWDATVISPGCPQDCKLPSPQYMCPPKQKENCLYLNIYAPKDAKMLPVMVYFHGGDFIQGFGGSLLYDGRFLVNQTNTILVTVNYRLHAFGYLVYGTGDRAITGNQGLKDQILSLQWVHSNIENFGGDPGRVTIGGQSAGAISSSVLMTSIQASGLFHQVIVESDPFGVPLKSMTDATRLGKDFARALGCGTNNDYDCLYSKNSTQVTKAAMAVDSALVNPLHIFEIFLQWSPVVDEDFVSDQTLTLFEKGRHPDVPILMGTTAQEGVLFVHQAFSSELKRVEYDAFLFALYQFDYSVYLEVQKMYPSTEGDNRLVAADMTTDRTFICPTRHAAQVYSNQTINLHTAPVFLYVFNHSWSFEQAWEPGFSYCDDYSCHSAELPFVFGTVSLANMSNITFSENEKILSNSMMQYWGNFVKYGNPNGDFTEKTAQLLSWPEYMSLDKWNLMRFKTPDNEVIEDYHQDYCNVWDKIGYALGLRQ